MWSTRILRKHDDPISINEDTSYYAHRISRTFSNILEILEHSRISKMEFREYYSRTSRTSRPLLGNIKKRIPEILEYVLEILEQNSTKIFGEFLEFR